MCLYTNIQKHEVNNIFMKTRSEYFVVWILFMKYIKYISITKKKYTSCELSIHQQILGEKHSMMVPHISFKQQNHFQLW